MPVVTEPFSQWVIEDRFPAGRPHFEDSGATLVADVAPFELAKLRLLNGSHSTLAYLGYLAGLETIAEVMADENFARLVAGLSGISCVVWAYWDEGEPRCPDAKSLR